MSTSGPAPGEQRRSRPSSPLFEEVELPAEEFEAGVDADLEAARRAPATSRLSTIIGQLLPGRDATSSRWGPYALVALAVGFGLVTLASERLPVAYNNDSSVHSLTVSFATQQLKLGHFPLDGWFPFLSLGSPFFLHYQSFSAVLTGLLGEVIGAQKAFGWTLYLILSFWPLSVYIGARLFDFDRWTAGIAAALAPLAMNTVGYGFEHEAYIFYGSGLWSQLWGMIVLPIAWGLSWRAVSRRQNVFWAVVSLGAVIIFHFLTAYLAGLSLLVFAFIRPTEVVRRLRRVIVVGLGAVLVAAWVIVPLIATAQWAATNEFQVGTYFNNSYGARQVLSWLFTGNVFDAPLAIPRFPIFSILVAIGLFTCVVRIRRDERARAVLAVFFLSLFLYFGRTTFGALVDILPDNGDLLFARYISGVQLSGMLLGGIGATSVVRLLASLVRSRLHLPRPDRLRGRLVPRFVLPSCAVLLVVGVLYPAWHEVATYDAYSTSVIDSQQVSDATAGAQVQSLVDIANADGGGRIYAGEPGNWGNQFKVGSTPVYIYLIDIGANAMGFTLRTSSLMTGPEVWFDEYETGDYTLFGVHYLLLPVGHPPPVPATLVQQSGPYELYTVANIGLIHVVDTTTSLSANGSDLGAATKNYLDSDISSLGQFETVAYANHPAAPPTVGPGPLPTGPAGTVLSEHDNLDQGEATATVTANRTAVVLLSASFDVGWTVTVDGASATPEMIAPALVGVTVGPGTHTVFFRYQSFAWYPELFVVSLITVVAFAVVCRRKNRTGPRPSRSPQVTA